MIKVLHGHAGYVRRFTIYHYISCDGSFSEFDLLSCASLPTVITSFCGNFARCPRSFWRLITFTFCPSNNDSSDI